MLRSFSTKSNSKYHIFPSVKSFGRDIWCIFFLHEVKQEGRIIVVAWVWDFGGDISVAVIGGWRPDDIVSFDAPYQPVNALFHAVPGQPRRGQDHAVPLANRFSIILKDWFHLSNTHAFWKAMISTDSFLRSILEFRGRLWALQRDLHGIRVKTLRMMKYFHGHVFSTKSISEPENLCTFWTANQREIQRKPCH